MEIPNIPTGAVVVGVDGSDHARRGVAWGVAQAVRENRTVVLAFAYDAIETHWAALPGVDLAALQQDVAQAGRSLVEDLRTEILADHPDLEVLAVSVMADARDLLLTMSETASTVVIGSRGRGAVRSLLLGSVALAVTRHSTCPVIVLRPESGGEDRAGVIVAVDATGRSSATLDYAFRAASWLGEPLTVLHCFWDAAVALSGAGLVPAESNIDEERAAVSEVMAGFAERYPDVATEAVFAQGLVDQVLLELSAGKTLLVVGSRSRSSIAEFVLGSVASTMVEQASSPVAVVPRKESAGA